MRLATLAVFFSLFLATAMPSSGQSTDLGQSAAAISPHTIREYSLPPDKLEKAHGLYSLSTKVQFVDAAYGFAILIAALFLAAGAKVRDWAERISERKWVQGLLVIPILAIAIAILTIP